MPKRPNERLADLIRRELLSARMQAHLRSLPMFRVNPEIPPRFQYLLSELEIAEKLTRRANPNFHDFPPKPVTVVLTKSKKKPAQGGPKKKRRSVKRAPR